MFIIITDKEYIYGIRKWQKLSTKIKKCNKVNNNQNITKKVFIQESYKNQRSKVTNKKFFKSIDSINLNIHYKFYI